MIRAIAFLVTGVLAGSGGVYLLGHSDSVPAAGRAVVVPAAGSEPEDSLPEAFDSGPALGFASERLAVYEQAARLGSPAELEAGIRRAASEPPSPISAARLRALLLVLAERDPDRAARVAQSRLLDASLLAPLYQAWIQADADAALAELARVSSPAEQREIALALLDVLGHDRNQIERVAAALPEADRFSFGVDALVARAGSDPAGALETALAEDNALIQGLVISRLARAMARGDASGALVRASLIEDDELRRFYTSEILDVLAGEGPEAVLAYLESVDPTELEAHSTFVWDLANRDPERMLALAGRLPPAARAGLERAALQSLAERDPIAALNWLESMPPGMSRSLLYGTVARAYAEQSPDAALAWARTLSPPSRDAMNGVLLGIAAVDTDRAVDLILDEVEPDGLWFGEPPALALPQIASVLDDPGPLLDGFLESGIGDAQTQSLIVSGWAQNDREAAMEWALANDDRLEPGIWFQAAQRFAREDPEAAIQAVEGVGLSQRAGYIAGVAATLAQSDVERATRLADGQRGQPGYADALGSVAMFVAQQDADAARDWILSLENGPARDAGLSSALLAGVVADSDNTTLDRRLLDAYSSDTTRQQGIVNALINMGLENPDQARRLMNRHVTDPELRRMTEAQLDGTGGAGRTPGAVITFTFE